ncbi:uncharacterized protein LOC131587574 [Poecile atricapillus]|uniref:uncharacterized protein LOC131587574 n=1 Tax=Poecile atricapillus TaxID=48891 RepID=UPI0027395395|nr:uncharacterized protein LOC131587574 [Poecile atricapillus]
MAAMRGRWPERGLTVAAAAGPERKGLRVRRAAASAAERPPAAGLPTALPVRSAGPFPPGNGQPRQCLMGSAPRRAPHTVLPPAVPSPHGPTPCHPRLCHPPTAPHRVTPGCAIPPRPHTVSPPAVPSLHGPTPCHPRLCHPPTAPAVSPAAPRRARCPSQRDCKALPGFPGEPRVPPRAKGSRLPEAPKCSAPQNTRPGAATPLTPVWELSFRGGWDCSRVPLGTPRVPPAQPGALPPRLGV